MRLYLADCGSKFKSVEKRMIENGSTEGKMYNGVDILQSFYYCNSYTEKVIIPNCKSFMLDSGAFTFMTSKKNKQINWIGYIERYADFINRNKLDLFFELDIDCVVGYEKVLEYREYLEKLTGKKCIPVWHKSRGKEEYIKMCKEYPYVAIGGIVTKEISKNEYPMLTELINIAHENGAKVHGLGFTNLKGINQYPFDSVDSTTWTTGNRFGVVFEFTGNTIVGHPRKEGRTIPINETVEAHNFCEWTNLQKYLETTEKGSEKCG